MALRHGFFVVHYRSNTISMDFEVLSQYKSVFIAFHMLGFIFGLGGATIADTMFSIIGFGLRESSRYKCFW